MATIYKGNDNPIKLILRQGTTPYNITGYSKIELVVSDSITYDTDSHSSNIEADSNRIG